MKKILKSVFAIAIAALAFTSCDDVPMPYDKPSPNRMLYRYFSTQSGIPKQVSLPYGVVFERYYQEADCLLWVISFCDLPHFTVKQINCLTNRFLRECKNSKIDYSRAKLFSINFHLAIITCNVNTRCISNQTTAIRNIVSVGLPP